MRSVDTSASNGAWSVLVLGDDDRMVLPIVRSLGRRGVRVHLAWCPPDSAALKSRVLTQAHNIPIYVPGQSAWRDALNRLIARERFDVILPATEGAVYVLQTHRNELDDVDKIYLLDDEAYRVVISKRRTYRLAQSLDIPCPESREVSMDQDIDKLLDEVGLPLVIKPSCPLHDSGQLTKHFVRTAHSKSDAIAYLEYLAANDADALLQRYFSGVGVGVELLADRGEVLVAMQHRRLHETNGYGSTYRQSVPLCESLRRASAKLMRALNYTGVAMVEFRLDEATGNWILLEINGRFWGSLPLAVAAGADFPFYLVQLLLTGQRDFPQSYQTGVRSRSLAGDARWLWRRLKGKGRVFSQENKGCLGWSVNDVSLGQCAKDLLRGLALIDHVDTFTWDDPVPALTEAAHMVRGAMARLLLGAATSDEPAHDRRQPCPTTAAQAVK